MADPQSAFDPEALLAHTAWLHNLARSLVGDVDRAADVVQETWLRAIERPPRDARTPRAWLATVLRSVFFKNLRADAARRQREERVALAETISDAAGQALERAETQQLLVDLVIKLEEPYRSAVLLRFFEDRKPEEIARATGVHVTTIRRRLRLGLGCLRARLDARYASDRSAWQAVLIPFFGVYEADLATGRTATAVGSGAFTTAIGQLGGLLTMKKIVVSSALIIILCGVAVVTANLVSSRVDLEDSIAGREPALPSDPKDAEGAQAPALPETVENALLAGGAYNADSGVGIARMALGLRARKEADGLKFQTRTDSKGAFRFDDVPPGGYMLERLDTPPGYRAPTPGSAGDSIEITLEPGESRNGVELKLLPEVPLRGRVVENSVHNPAVGARVVLVGGPDFEELQETISAEEGTFVFDGLGPLEAFYLAAEKNGFRTRTRTQPLSEKGRPDVLLAIDSCEEPVSVSGRVVDLEGQPLSDMRVLAENGPPNSKNNQFDGFTVTDAEGGFELTLVPGSFNLTVTPSEMPERWYEWGRLEVEAGEEVTDLELVYDRVYSIAGGVYDPDGEPIAGARVVASGGGSVTTDEAGRYTITRLGPHTYNVSASAENYTSARISGVAAGSDSTDFALTPSGYEISGRVLDAETEEPLPEFELSWDEWPGSWGSPHLYSGNIYRFESFSGAYGRFSIRDASRVGWKWKLLLIARAKGYASALKLVDLDESDSDEPILYLQPDGEIVGIVRDAEGYPVGGAEIYYQHVVRKIDQFDRERAIARTMSDGSFRVASFPQEPQQLAVYHPDFASCFIEISPHDARNGTVEIVMTQGGTVRGRVVAMPESSSVRLTVSEGRWRSQRTNVDEDGAFTLDKIFPLTGIARLSMSYDDVSLTDSFHRYTLIERPVNVEDGKPTEIEFRLQESTSVLKGTVELGDLVPGSLEITATMTTEAGVEKHRVHADAEGRYFLDHLPAGEATVTVTLSQQGGAETVSPPQQVSIPNGETVTRDFGLSR